MMDIERQKRVLSALCKQAFGQMNLALGSFSAYGDATIAVQFTSQAFQLVLMANRLYLEQCEEEESLHFESFRDKFNDLNRAFLETLAAKDGLDESRELLSDLGDLLDQLYWYWYAARP